MKVLILSTADDAHARVVARILNGMKVSCDFFRYDHFPDNCSLSYTLGPAGDKSTALLEHQERRLDLNTYTSIWHRRPGRVRAGQFAEPWIAQMVESEARAALDGIMRNLPTTWVNFPPNDIACMNKLWQLRLATQLGFSIPDTLITNEAERVREFYENCNGLVIYKLIGEGSSFAIPPTETPTGIATLPLRAEDLPFLNQVVHAPHLFQRCIQKSYDLRVTIVGHKLFCISIDSQSGKSKVDWRNDYSVEMKRFPLPKEIESKCFALMRDLGLNYGAIDLVLDTEGQYVFLEINCGGQYLWIEEKTDLKISQAVAELLAGRSAPLVETGLTASTAGKDIL